MIIRREDLAVTPWRNDLGRKADIANGEGWALSFAWLDADADFSDFTGFDRTQILLEGTGFVLDFGDEEMVVDRPAHPHEYDGGRPVTARLLDGPCVVLNVISERSRYSHSVEVTDAVPAEGFAVLLDGTYDTIRLPDEHNPAPGIPIAVVHFRLTE